MTEPVAEESWYPDTGLLAILARLALVGVVLAVVVAVFLPPELVPRFARSHYLQHFAAFYVVTVACLAALPRAQLRRVAGAVVMFATVLEATHLINGARLDPLISNWVADVGGVFAAVVPVAVDRFRRRFRPRNKPESLT